MMRKAHRATDIYHYSLAAPFAENRATVEDRLEVDELTFFIEIGDEMYRQGRTDFLDDVPGEDMFPMNDN